LGFLVQRRLHWTDPPSGHKRLVLAFWLIAIDLSENYLAPVEEFPETGSAAEMELIYLPHADSNLRSCRKHVLSCCRIATVLKMLSRHRLAASGEDIFTASGRT